MRYVCECDSGLECALSSLLALCELHRPSVCSRVCVCVCECLHERIMSAWEKDTVIRTSGYVTAFEEKENQNKHKKQNRAQQPEPEPEPEPEETQWTPMLTQTTSANNVKVQCSMWRQCKPYHFQVFVYFLFFLSMCYVSNRIECDARSSESKNQTRQAAAMRKRDKERAPFSTILIRRRFQWWFYCLFSENCIWYLCSFRCHVWFV